MNPEILKSQLLLMVPLHIPEVRARGEEWRLAYCKKHAAIVSGKGDEGQFSEKKGVIAGYVNILAKCLACLAFQPGGVQVFGLSFEVTQ